MSNSTNNSADEFRENNLRRIRKDSGIPRAKLALAAGLSDGTVKKIESGLNSVRDESKSAAFNGLNKLLKELGRDQYEYKDVFPGES